MHGLRIMRGEVLSGSSNPGTTVYEQTVAALGKDPEKLFPSGPASADNCACGWVGHKTYGFCGVGEEYVPSRPSPRSA